MPTVTIIQITDDGDQPMHDELRDIHTLGERSEVTIINGGYEPESSAATMTSQNKGMMM